MWGPSTLLALRGIWGAIPGSVKIGAVAAVGAVLAAWAIHHHGVSQGREQGREAALKQSVETLRERNLTDEKVRDMGSAELCIALGGRLSDDGTCQ